MFNISKRYITPWKKFISSNLLTNFTSSSHIADINLWWQFSNNITRNAGLTVLAMSMQVFILLIFPRVMQNTFENSWLTLGFQTCSKNWWYEPLDLNFINIWLELSNWELLTMQFSIQFSFLRDNNYPLRNVC